MPRLARLTPDTAVGASHDLLSDLVARHGEVGDMAATMVEFGSASAGRIKRYEPEADRWLAERGSHLDLVLAPGAATLLSTGQAGEGSDVLMREHSIPAGRWPAGGAIDGPPINRRVQLGAAGAGAPAALSSGSKPALCWIATS
jgi:hypothetical protein